MLSLATKSLTSQSQQKEKLDSQFFWLISGIALHVNLFIVCFRLFEISFLTQQKNWSDFYVFYTFQEETNFMSLEWSLMVLNECESLHFWRWVFFSFYTVGFLKIYNEKTHKNFWIRDSGGYWQQKIIASHRELESAVSITTIGCIIINQWTTTAANSVIKELDFHNRRKTRWPDISKCELTHLTETPRNRTSDLIIRFFNS